MYYYNGVLKERVQPLVEVFKKNTMEIINALLIDNRPGLLEAWLVLTSVKYHGNLYILIPRKVTRPSFFGGGTLLL